MNVAYTFDDILIVPQYSEVSSRSDVSVETNLTKNIVIESPIISANMDTVTEHEMACAMRLSGGAGIIHRFLSIEDQVEQVRLCRGAGVGAAVGINGDYLERAKALVAAGVSFLCLDVAHGHSKSVGEALRNLNALGLDVIAGNVATGEGARFLAESGAAAIKVGVGPGAMCSTRIVAGVGVPQFSSIIDCSIAVQEYGIPVIADGGIRTPSDVAKAIAAGASTVMVGSLLAPTVESPGEIVVKDGESYKAYRGMASKEAMESKDSALGTQSASNITPEGVSTLVPFDPETTASSVVSTLVGGLRSAMSYTNATTISDFHQKVQFVPITMSGLIESHPHGLSK